MEPYDHEEEALMRRLHELVQHEQRDEGDRHDREMEEAAEEEAAEEEAEEEEEDLVAVHATHLRAEHEAVRHALREVLARSQEVADYAATVYRDPLDPLLGALARGIGHMELMAYGLMPLPVSRAECIRLVNVLSLRLEAFAQHCENSTAGAERVSTPARRERRRARTPYARAIDC